MGDRLDTEPGAGQRRLAASRRGRTLAPLALLLALGAAAVTALASVGGDDGVRKAVVNRLLITDAPALEPVVPVTRPGRAQFDAARRYAAVRRGVVSLAVVDSSGRLLAHRGNRRHWSASVVKAMIMVAYLNRIGDRPLDAWSRSQLNPMIRRSDNATASRLFRLVGRRGLERVARRAGMTGFGYSPVWGSTLTTAADQARMFARIEKLLPARHRSYARRLLSSIVSWQRWGIRRAAPARYRVLFKGGWRNGMRDGKLVNQVARVDDGLRRFSIAVLTDANPTHEYGVETVRGVARRLLR